MKEKRMCQNCKNIFIIEDEDFDFYKKIDVPPPTWCPECRMMRRMVWRNERMLHKRKSSFSGEEMISQYSENAPFPVFSVREYFSRNWDVPSQEYDSGRSFFDQFEELRNKTPHSALLTDLQSLENGSIYQNGASRNKNCYMVSASGDNEDCMYSNNLDYSKTTLDCLWSRRMELSYECVNSMDSNRLFFSQVCRHCVNCWFLYECKNCVDCFGCVDLRHKKYCLWNKQLSKETYEKEVGRILAKLTREDLSSIASEFRKFELLFPKKYAHIDSVSSPTCTGDYIVSSKNVKNGFTVHESQNSHYCSKLILGKECYDMTDWGDPAELCYESITVGKSAYKVFFSNDCWPECRELEYCDSCSNSHHLFGCVGMRDSSFCVLNKQYSEKEYSEIVSQIKFDMKKNGEYGEFFPFRLSPFPYNESIAQEHFPLNKDKANAKGFMWSESESRNYKTTLRVENLPLYIKDVSDSITNEIILCAHAGASDGCNHECTTAFKITQGELVFYRRFGIPLPSLCFNCRHAERFGKRSQLKLWTRRCMCNGVQSTNSEGQKYHNTAIHKHGDTQCPNEFETNYAPDRPEIVYCEQCYQKEVI